MYLIALYTDICTYYYMYMYMYIHLSIYLHIIQLPTYFIKFKKLTILDAAIWHLCCIYYRGLSIIA